MIKIAGMPPKYYNTINTSDFIQQANEFKGFDEDNIDKIAKILSVMYKDHPWTVLRGYEMNKWIQSGRYGGILNKYQYGGDLSNNNYASIQN